MVIPDAFHVAIAGRAADGAGYPGDNDWLAQVPSLVDEHFERWDLTAEGKPWHGENALVFPVLREAQPAVLKVTWPHLDARHEYFALKL